MEKQTGKKNIHKKVGLHFNPEDPKSISRTKQEFRKEADINNIMAKYLKTGTIEHINRRKPIYADITNLGDFQENMNMIAEAKAEFASLPAKVRDRFQNDPHRLIQFLEDELNHAEAIQLGLMEPKKVEAVVSETGATGDTNNSGSGAPGAESASAPGSGQKK